MYVYRISQTKYANSLQAPGIYGRWNSEGQRIIYTAGSVALACLENVVHRSGAALSSGKFSIAIIAIEKDVSIGEFSINKLTKLSADWYKVENYPITQQIGDRWLADQSSALLKIPSAIIEHEYNYLINPNHPHFSKIKISSVEPFKFDPRLKSNL